MTELEAIEAILGQWESEWEDLHPADPSDPDHVPWTTENEPYTAPSGAPWTRITVVHSTSRQSSFGKAGTRQWERRGTIYVQVFGPVNEGRARLAELCDDVRTVLEGKRLGDLVTYSAGTYERANYLGFSGPSPEDGSWLMHVVTVPFRYEHQS